MPAVEISAEIASKIEDFAHRMGESKDDFVREAILSYLSECEGTSIATHHRVCSGKCVSLVEVGGELGLAH